MNTTMYRIYTYTERLKAETIMAAHFDGFTMIATRGYWKGTPEDSVCFEVLTDDGAKVQKAAEEIRAVLDQEAVLVTREATVATFVTEEGS